jgi:pyruvate formate lyase activating enzyme
MKIAGFKKQSFIDYSGNISSVIFTQGCNFRCGFCHNPNLVLPKKFGETYNNEEIKAYLKKYAYLLDAVCITGGEPTIHRDLPLFISEIKTIGLKVKLDTNGTNPKMLKKLISNKQIDFIAMDIKHLLIYEYYSKVVGNCINNEIFNKIKSSISIIRSSTIDYEFRTTIAKGLHKKNDIKILKKYLGEKYHIQNFNSEIILNPKLNIETFSKVEFDEMLN